MTLRSQWTLAALLFVIVGIAVLGVRPLVPPDEPRYGIIAAQMAESGEWFALRMAEFRYYEKPPLSFWVMAASIELFGENAFAIRLPAALATGVTALVTGLLCARMTRRPELGPIAFAVQVTTLGPAVLGTVAIIDPVFTMWITLALAAAWMAIASSGRLRLAALMGLGASTALAILTKGLLGFAIPALAIGAFLSWQRRWRDIFVLPWIPLIACAAVLAPFAWGIHRVEPDFWRYFWIVEHWRRFTAPDSNQHGQPWWYLIAMLPLGGFMWTLAWWHAGRALKEYPQCRDGIRFALTWIIAPLTLLSLSKGKIATYALPLFPPLSALVAIGLLSAKERGIVVASWSNRIGRWILRGLALGAVVLAFTGTQWSGIPTLWDSGESLRWIAVACVLLLWAWLDRFAWRATDATSWLRRTAWAPVGMIALLPALFPTAGIRTSAVPWRMLDAHAAAIRDADCILTGSQIAHCVSWATRRRDLVIVGYASEFDNELGRDDETARRLGLADAAATIARRCAAGETVALVTQSHEAREIAKTARAGEPALKVVSDDTTIMIWSTAPGATP